MCIRDRITWDTPKDVESLILWSYFAKDQGPKNFDVLVTKDGDAWEQVATSGDITWQSNACLLYTSNCKAAFRFLAISNF